jgi:hypothetical protein
MRYGGFWVLTGAAVLAMPAIDLLRIPRYPGNVMLVGAGLAIVAAVVWVAVRRD